MRIRSAKTLAHRIDLNYFKRSRGLRRWRIGLSIAIPAAALVWVGGLAAAGSRRPYSAGPVSMAHAFAENRCEVCHPRTAPAQFRFRASDSACLSCHDAPPHVAAGVGVPQPPSCATCHQEHRGRIVLAKTDDRFCLDCHRAPHPGARGSAGVVALSGAFPSGHPEFAALRNHVTNPTGLIFNHAVHLARDGIAGPKGLEHLQCDSCHRQEIAATTGRRVLKTGLMAPATYAQTCARCHPLFFDERLDAQAPHDTPPVVRDAVRRALSAYIEEHPDDIRKSDSAVRRVPLNFPRPPEPPARTAAEWVTRRIAADERILWNKTCAECHAVDRAAAMPRTPGVVTYPTYQPSNVARQWFTRASFDHSAHAMVTCTSCHAADKSTTVSDVLLPGETVCATCHAPSKGAESRCFECHSYHDWTKAHRVQPPYDASTFK